MEGDLNLSQALGGLRIANQTDDSPPPSPKTSVYKDTETASYNSREEDRRDDYNHSNEDERRSGSQIHISDLQSLDAMTPISGSTHMSSTSSLPLGSAGQQHPASSSQTSFSSAPHPYQPLQQRSTYPGTSNASQSRNSSQFSQSYNGGQNGPYPTNAPTYPYTRMSREPSRSSLHGPPGLHSRPSQRERPGQERPYRSSPPSGPYPLQTPDGGTAAAVAAVGESGSAVAPQQQQQEFNENAPLPSSDEWKERGAATTIHREIDANGNVIQRIVKKGVKDFNFGRTLGEGSYSTVLAATDRTTLKEYAIKVLDKRHIIKEDKVKYVNIEKNTLNRLGDHPGVVRLYYTFQDERSLYFVLDLAAGGELLGTLKRLGTFDEECTRYYAAQILDTIEYMHSKAVIHRDLKPENVLLDEKMRVKITDFGTAKILDPPKKQNGEGEQNGGDSADGLEEVRANSFVGTAEYVSPELLTEKAACKASDLWAFGCIVFQLLAGRPPFKASNEYQTFQKIVHLEYEFPKGFPPVAKDLVERLLVLDPTKRLTIENIKKHEFFEGIEWGRRLWKQKAPRLKPYQPPPEEPKIIKLSGGGTDPAPPRNGAAPNGRPTVPRVITELPPPSQLDIEWSPVLARANERILKLGNATVQSSPAPHSPDGKSLGEKDATKKFSRFFGGRDNKKRQRLVIVTSAAHVIIAAADGNDKKPKTDINLQGLGVIVRRVGGPDSTTWAIDTRDKCYTFEDPKTPASEWLEQVERAREMAALNYPHQEDGFMPSSLSSPSSTLTLDAAANGHGHHHSHRSEGRQESGGEGGRNKRFSKRNSRHGLAAVF